MFAAMAIKSIGFVESDYLGPIGVKQELQDFIWDLIQQQGG